jgi:hypothetical protein
LFYHKPLSGWGAENRPRSANFNDSAALFRPSGDLLLHLAVRERETVPAMAGLARWLFDTLYASQLTQGPHDVATFGFSNEFGFLAVPLLPAAVTALSPADAGLTPLELFGCGDVMARDSWDGRTILAVHGGGDPLQGAGHLHGDLNSFILVHNRERLLVDPGHSCYRNLLHDLECNSRTHNTCTFTIDESDNPEAESGRPTNRTLDQPLCALVNDDRGTGKPGPPVDRGARRLIVARSEDVSVIGSDAAALYGPVIREFSRFWILCGANVLFVVDRIVSARPVRTSWHWLFNNRDGGLELKVLPPDRVVARRGNAGMKLFHLGKAKMSHPLNAFVHDVYSPIAGAREEGRSGSGLLLGWEESAPATERTVVHAVGLDDYGVVAGWHLKQHEGNPVLESPGSTSRWTLDTAPDASAIAVTEAVSGRGWKLYKDEGTWKFETAKG